MTSEAPEPVCEHLDTLNGDSMKFEECGQPRDPKLSRMLGKNVCVDHGEDALKELMA